MKSRVALVPCTSYDQKLVYDKLKEALELVGGIEQYAEKEEQILMKLNLVRGAQAERAVTTHPAVVEALARILHEKGYEKLQAGDSSGFGSPSKTMQDLGLGGAFEKYGVSMAECKDGVTVAFPQGVHAKEFILSKEVVDCDCLISVSKMKTHALEFITGAVKNQYGCVQGFNKAKGHTAYPSQESFARMLIDLNLCVKPKLYIMDGIMAMEGNGPTSGSPTPMNVLLASSDPVALDTVFATLVHLKTDYVPTNTFGEQMGLGTYHEENIEIVTPDGSMTFEEVQKKYGNPGFDVVRKKSFKGKGIMGAVTFLKHFGKKPRINKDLCKKCGICVESCPVDGKALHFSNGRKEAPVYNYKKCIRCFCCQEMCPHKAIYVK